MSDDHTDRWMAETHRVENQPEPLENHNLFSDDQPLVDWCQHGGLAADDAVLLDQGEWAGRAETIALGFQANENPPDLQTHDRYGHRVDEVRFHPAYHELMQRALETGLHCDPWLDPAPGAHVHRAARYYLQAQVDAGHGCPITMTFAAVPVLQKHSGEAARWLSKVTARGYDSRNVPHYQKNALTLGMAMTEKQGGSDVRANTTRAHPIAGNDGAYELVGHKYFVSAPMSDGFLALAQAPYGLTCFLVPRWRPDGRKNPLQLQRLKAKMGNVSNASSETELRGALGWRLGDEGAGIRTIIEMVALTRFDCMIGSSAGMRQAVSQAVHHSSRRSAFGAALTQQPIMAAVLADLALESEAALALTWRLAAALDQPDDAHEQALLRVGTAIGKYWLCKRAPGHAYEAMECLGGSGLMENCIMPRLFRESPVNAVWEGSGNIQCLDVLRALHREPGITEALFSELDRGQGEDPRFDRWLSGLRRDWDALVGDERRARELVHRLAVGLQAAVLLTGPAAWVGEAFCAARLDDSSTGWLYGQLPPGVDTEALIARHQLVAVT